MFHDSHYPGYLQAILTLAHGLGTDLDAGRIEFYWEQLHDVSWADFSAACAMAGKYSKGFPYPATLREYAEQAREARRAASRPATALLNPAHPEEYESRLTEVRALIKRLGGTMMLTSETVSEQPASPRPLHVAYRSPKEPILDQPLRGRRSS